jgi:hypothetical protein
MSAGLTHPVVASLDHPLFACGGKRVAAINFKKAIYRKYFTVWFKLT